MDVMDEDQIPILVEAIDSIEPEDKRVPITLISGFLGAGKSTLLKQILTERHGYRIAVIMNEFGDTADIEAKAINVSSTERSDADLGNTSEEFLELANGCLCCSIKDSGVAAIEKLMRRKGAFDHILLETTGLADPGPIAAMFWQNEEFAMGLGKDIYLDGVICVIDAVFIEKQIEEDDESEGIKHSLRQIAAADVLLLNKSDLVPELDLLNTESMLHQLNPSIPIYRTIHGQIDLSKIMGIGAYSEKSRTFLDNLAQGEALGDHEHCSHHEHDHGSSEARHAGISNFIVRIPKPLTDPQISALDKWIRTVLWEGVVPHAGAFHTNSAIRLPPSYPPNLTSAMGTLSILKPRPDLEKKHVPDVEVLRCKGTWQNENGEQFVLQGVRCLYDVSKLEAKTKLEGGLMAGKLVFIGKGLNDAVEESLRKVVASERFMAERQDQHITL